MPAQAEEFQDCFRPCPFHEPIGRKEAVVVRVPFSLEQTCRPCELQALAHDSEGSATLCFVDEGACVLRRSLKEPGQPVVRCIQETSFVLEDVEVLVRKELFMFNGVRAVLEDQKNCSPWRDPAACEPDSRSIANMLRPLLVERVQTRAHVRREVR